MEYDGGVGAALGNLDMDTPAKPKRAKPPPGPPPRGQAKKYAAPLAPANGAGLQTPKFAAFFRRRRRSPATATRSSPFLPPASRSSASRHPVNSLRHRETAR